MKTKTDKWYHFHIVFNTITNEVEKFKIRKSRKRDLKKGVTK